MKIWVKRAQEGETKIKTNKTWRLETKREVKEGAYRYQGPQRSNEWWTHSVRGKTVGVLELHGGIVGLSNNIGLTNRNGRARRRQWKERWRQKVKWWLWGVLISVPWSTQKTISWRITQNSSSYIDGCNDDNYAETKNCHHHEEMCMSLHIKNAIISCVHPFIH